MTMVISEVCKRNVATVGKDASVLRAAAIMRQHKVHDLVVVERRCGGWAPAGIITEHDIAIEVVGQGLDPRYVTVDAAMSSRVSALGNDGSDGGGGGGGNTTGAMAMEAMLALLVTELNHIGQPIRHHQLTQPARPARPAPQRQLT